MTFVIWNDTAAIGDTLCSFPGTLRLAQERAKQHDQVAIRWTNPAVGDLFPHEKYGLLRDDTTVPATILERISVHEMVHKGRRYPSRHEHPTAQFLAHVGFPDESVAPLRPEIIEAEGGSEDLQFDALISPYVLAERPRMWPIDRWDSVADHLRKRVGRVATVGSNVVPPIEHLRKINPYQQTHFADNVQQSVRVPAGTTPLFDRSLLDVAWAMKHAKIVVTVDTGTARLAHAVGCNHLLLAHNDASFDWSTYPECPKILYQDMMRLLPGQVIAAIDEMLEVG